MSKKLIETQSRFYVNAKRASQEYEGVTRGLIRGAVSIPPQGTIQEIQQVYTCVKYLNKVMLSVGLCASHCFSWEYGDGTLHGRNKTLFEVKTKLLLSREVYKLLCKLQY